MHCLLGHGGLLSRAPEPSRKQHGLLAGPLPPLEDLQALLAQSYGS
jgi:hypothetical protein